MAKDKLAGRQISPLDAYRGRPDVAAEDARIMAQTTEELIDMQFIDFAKFMEDKNIGELRAFRGLLHQMLDKTDRAAKLLTDDVMVKLFKKDDRVKLGSVYGLVNKIVDRISYVDYLTEKNSIK